MSQSKGRKRKKKILILANNDIGLYQFRKELIDELLLQNNEVFISLPDGEFVSLLVQKGCKFISTPVDRRGINPKKDFKLVKHYFKILKRVKPDLVITYTIKPNIYGGFACRMKKIPYAVNITGLGTTFQKEGLLKSFVIFLYKVALKKAKVVFFENSENMKIFQQLKICKKEQTKLLNGAGVNLEHYRYIEYPSKQHPIHFLFIGRIMKEKGVEELFSAMEKLHREGQDCVLDMLGEYEEDYKAVMEKYKKAGWLNYYGYQKDIRPFIKEAHCFVLPSWHEGMANTNLECAASGRPVITSNISGCKEAVINGKSGLLCEAKDVNSLYQVMKEFLEYSIVQKIQMGQQGRRYMEKIFDKKKVVEMTLKGLKL